MESEDNVDRFERGIYLAKTAVGILAADKRLLLFTLLSAFCTIAVSIVMFLPVIDAVRQHSQTYEGLPITRLCILCRSPAPRYNYTRAGIATRGHFLRARCW